MPTLTQLFVEFSEKGLSTVQAGMAKLKDQAAGTEKAIVSLAGSLKTAFVGATGVLYGFAAAGIAGSVQGERLSFQLKLLSLQVGSIFVPVVEKAISVTSEITNYLKEMSGEAQNGILKWAGLAGGIAMMATGLGFIPGLLTSVVAGMNILGVESAGVIKIIKDGFKGVSDFLETTPGKITAVTVGVVALSQALGVLPIVIKAIGVAIAFSTGGLLQLAGAVVAGVMAFNAIKESGTGAWGGIRDAVGGFVDFFKPIVSTIGELLSSIGSLFNETFALISEVVSIATPIIKVAIGIAIGVLESMASVLNKIVNILKWVTKNVRETIEAAKQGVNEFIHGEGSGDFSGKVAGAGGDFDNDAKKEDKPKNQAIPKSAGGFEQMGSAYGRIVQSVMSQFDPKKSADDAARQRDEALQVQKEIKQLLAKPGVAVAGV